jgi:CubicO group peptidase (beta-lactamase class C family)
MKNSLTGSLLTVLLMCFICISCADKQADTSLPRSIPEAEGVSSKAIITFLDSTATCSTEFHSFMIIRHGKIVAEGWWDPFSPELKHTLYSTSKSFTSTAVGFAVSEKKLSVDDKLISFFPEYLPDTVSPYLNELKIRDMLSMSTGQRRESSTAGDEWVKAFLNTPVEIEPGTRYRYSSLASFMLSATVQKVTGEKVIDYLTPRLFKPLGIDGADWETNPEGINTGGWGLRLKTEDLAKFGLLYLNKGSWKGQQILSKEWIEEAVSLKIYQNPNMTQVRRDSSNDAVQGYCWQFWRAKNNSYMANGAFGQFILIIPEKDAIVVFTAESSDMWGELGMVWKYIYPGIMDKALPEDSESVAELRKKSATLAIPPPPESQNVEMSSKISGKTITFAENQRLIKSMSLQFGEGLCLLNIKTDTATYDLSFGSGIWQPGETTMHGPSIFARAKNNLNGFPPFKIVGAYSWNDDQSLELTLRYIDSLHTLRIIFHFDNEKVVVDFRESISPGNRFTSIEGNLQ